MGMRGLGRTHTNKDHHVLPETPHSNDFLLFSSFPNFSCLINWFHDHFNWLLILCVVWSPFLSLFERRGLANENIYVNSTLIFIDISHRNRDLQVTINHTEWPDRWTNSIGTPAAEVHNFSERLLRLLCLVISEFTRNQSRGWGKEFGMSLRISPEVSLGLLLHQSHWVIPPADP